MCKKEQCNRRDSSEHDLSFRERGHKKSRCRHYLWLLLFLIAAGIAFVAIGSTFVDATVNVRLAWDPSPDPTVTGYKIYYSKSNWEQAVVIDAGNRTEYTVLGLAAGVTYQFAATACNRAGGESALSNVVTYPPDGVPPIAR